MSYCRLKPIPKTISSHNGAGALEHLLMLLLVISTQLCSSLWDYYQDIDYSWFIWLLLLHKKYNMDQVWMHGDIAFSNVKHDVQEITFTNTFTLMIKIKCFHLFSLGYLFVIYCKLETYP